MVEPINLNKARKAKARAQKEQTARENRIKFGRSKAEKARDTLESKRQNTDLEDKKRDP